ncbi:MAG: riboflavin biosynthesis protein RibF [Mediterranea sp.]|jgi:riboflavin kinase/FMN adenylyltransferase|nr:riboflavin biosynthesis protein RibF [Mediterranea sp.]
MQIITDNDITVAIQPCVATIGFFDGVHAGHRYLISQVREVAEERGLRSAALTFPIHPRKVMNPAYTPQSLTSFDEKTDLLAELGLDYCFTLPFSPAVAAMTAREFMERVLKERCRAQCLVIGYDHRFGHNRSEGFDDYVRYGQEMGIEVILAKAFSERIEGADVAVSSSLIRRQLLQGDMAGATRSLRHHYTLRGTVVGGFQVGHTIGYPTANVRVDDPEKLIPEGGVYAVWVWVDGQRHMGMLSIGTRPTFGDDFDRTIEVNILHFQADIYGRPIRIAFVRRTRSEEKYDTVDQLVAQLHRDAEEVEAILCADDQTPSSFANSSLR